MVVRRGGRAASIAAVVGAMAGMMVVLFVLEDGGRGTQLEQLNGGPFGPDDDKQASVKLHFLLACSLQVEIADTQSSKCVGPGSSG